MMNLKHNIWLCTLLILTTLIPRVLLIGGPPTTDEGIYAFNAMMVHAYAEGHSLIPDVGSLSLYSSLLSGVFASEINPFILLRLIDAIFASCTGLLLYLVIDQAAGDKKFAFFLTSISIITYNDPVFIQYGFKNSIHAALLPLLAALFIARKEIFSDFKWHYVGALTALAVLLREPFIIFAVLGAATLLIHSGRKAFIAYIVGGAVAGIFILTAIIFFRGGYSTLLSSYIDMGRMYAAIAYQKQSLTQSSLGTFVSNSAGMIFLAIVSAIAILMSAMSKLDLLKEAGFWILITAAPLLEPILKNGYPYHYGVCLIGLTGLIAYGYRVHTRYLRGNTWIWGGAISICFFLVLPKFIKLLDISKQYPVAQVLRSSSLSWPDKTISKSNYLLIAQVIKQRSVNALPTLSINGSMLGLIPLSATLPSHYSLSHLSYALLADQHGGADLRAKIYQCPPQFIVLTNSSPFRDASKLNSIIKSIHQYRQVAYITKSESRHYGHFDGLVYQWSAPLKECKI